MFRNFEKLQNWIWWIYHNIYGSFVLALRNVHHDSIRDNFDEYFMPVIEIKDFKALIGNKTLFDQPVKNKPEAYENLSK